MVSGHERIQLGNRKGLSCAFLTEEAFWSLGIASIVQIYDCATGVTAGGFVGWRVGEFLEVVLVGAQAHVDFGLEVGAAFQAILPFAGVALAVMISAESEPAVIAMATVPRV
jgi:hypothetical protein